MRTNFFVDTNLDSCYNALTIGTYKYFFLRPEGVAENDMAETPAYRRVAEQIKRELLSDLRDEPNTKLPTQEELAARFGVSRSTVLKSLARLTAEGRIQSRQGSGIYAVPVRASALPVEQDTISLLLPNLYEPIKAAACLGVERQARQRGCQVLLGITNFSIETERELIERHLAAGVKGIVLYPTARRQMDLATDFLTHWNGDVPLVTMDIACDAWNCSRVIFDNVQLGREMTNRLIEAGYRRIGCMHTTPDHLHSPIHDRARGWQMAMAEAGLEIPAAYHGWPAALGNFHAMQGSDGDRLSESLLSLDPLPEAVMAWNDNFAAYLIRSLMRRGICVPEDVRVTGFDSLPAEMRLFLPPFPSSRPDFARLGEIALDVVLAEAERKQKTCHYYPVPVVWQEEETGFSWRAEETAVVQSAVVPVRS